MSVLKRLGHAVKMLRVDNKMTLRELSQECDISINTIMCIEKGRDFNSKSLRKILDYYNKDINEFFNKI